MVTNNFGRVRRRGSILLLVLVVVAVLALTTQSYLELMQNERHAVRFHGRRAQAARLAESGVEYLKNLMSLSDDEIDALGGIDDNPTVLQAAIVDEPTDPSDRGLFTVFAPMTDAVGGQRFRNGLENESAKLHVNSLLVEDDQSAARERLMDLPGMEATIADAILDWLDDDDLPREFGVEADFYRNRTPPDEPRNGPIASLDELLAVRGVTRELLYGADVNHNFTIDSNETVGSASTAIAGGAVPTSDGDRGWSAYLTVFSSERIASPDGAELVDVNGSDLKTIHEDLTRDLGDAEAEFVVLYRQYGAQSQQSDGEQGRNGQNSNSQEDRNTQTRDNAEATRSGPIELDFTKQGEQQISSLLDLVDATVEIPADEEENTEAQTVASPWKSDAASEILELYDVAVVGAASRVAGRINLNIAPRPVLLSLPDMTAALTEQILARRDPAASDHRHAIWLLTERLVEVDAMKALEPYVTAGGDVYRGQVAGFFAGGGPVARVDVCLDCTGKRPRIVEWRDLTSLGSGFLPAELGMIEEPTK